MRLSGAYLGATALSLAMLLAAAAPVHAELSEAALCAGREAAEVTVLETDMTPHDELGPPGFYTAPVITQGTPLVLEGPAPGIVTFTVAAHLPEGYDLPPVGGFSWHGEIPALPAELAGGGKRARNAPGMPRIPPLHLHDARSNNDPENHLLPSVFPVRTDTGMPKLTFQ